MKDRIWVATICLHIMAAIYVIVAISISLYAEMPGQSPKSNAEFRRFGCTVALTFAAAVEIPALGLWRRKYWGWIGGLCIFGFNIPTLFFPLGALGLWALLSPGTRALFNVGMLTSVAKRRTSSTMRTVSIRLLVLTVAVIALAIAYVYITGVGMPPYSWDPEPTEVVRIHRLVGLALFGTAALCAALTVATYVAFWWQSRPSRVQ